MTATTARRPAATAYLTGTVDFIKYRDRDGGGFTIARLASGIDVKGEDKEQTLIEGQSYRFAGNYTEHHKYGRSFAADMWAQDDPADENAVQTYLAENAPGVGIRRAKMLWQKFGSDAVRVLREDCEEAGRACGLAAEDALFAARGLEKFRATEQVKLDLYALFAERGFAKQTTKRVIQWAFKRGIPLYKARQAVERNPFALVVDGVTGCGFAKIDKLYLDLGHPPETLKRQAVAVWNAVRIQGNGSVWILRMQIEDAIRQKIGKHATPDRAIRLAVRAGLLAERTSTTKCVGVYLADAKLARDERALATRLLELSDGPNAWPAIPDDAGLTDHQTAELCESLSRPVGLLLGTPGTGKTFSAAAVIRAAIHQVGVDMVAVCAPTGKAAVRITAALVANKITSLTATTIHSLLKFTPAGWGYSAANPIPQKYIFVDESSMADVSLACRLVESCSVGAHILWIGDPYQLPPVGPGAPLRDMQAGGIACGLLTEIKRNDGKIVRACAAIKDGQLFEVSERIDQKRGENLKLFDLRSAKEGREALVRVIERWQTKYREGDPEQPHPIWGVQVLCAMNKKSEVSRRELNRMLQPLLNPDGEKAVGMFCRVGDKVICLRNSWYQSVTTKRGLAGMAVSAWESDPAGEVYVANGDQGEVLAVAPKQFVAKFDEPNRVIKVGVGPDKESDSEDDDDAPKGRGCNFDLAYAITGHKSQGSQWPYIVIMADESGHLVCSREWWYTAVSRAERLCLIVGGRYMIDKQCRRRTLHTRNTHLKELLKPSPVFIPSVPVPAKSAESDKENANGCDNEFYIHGNVDWDKIAREEAD